VINATLEDIFYDYGPESRGLVENDGGLMGKKVSTVMPAGTISAK
jgi:hypothetical protein